MVEEKEKQITNITTGEALEIIKASWLSDHYQMNLQTLINWIKRYDLGFKFAGRWRIDKDKLEQFINMQK